MKKSILAVAGLAAVAGIAAPVAGVFAVDSSQTDTIEVTIGDNCAISYDGTTPHTAGVVSDAQGAAATAWSSNKVSGTMTNSTVSSNFGKSSFTVTCNNTKGSQVTLTADSLSTGGTSADTISLSTTAPSTDTIKAGSSWAIYSSAKSAHIDTAGVFWESTSAAGVSGATFVATYKVGLSATQEAGTYSADATYTLTAKS